MARIMGAQWSKQEKSENILMGETGAASSTSLEMPFF
jgi:hypothetical protein